jgi:SDR family mycofactocin-dependent oxidoreductase
MKSKGAAMTGRLTGKVALITGAARGQGRSHAIHLAAEGADIIAVDYLTSFDTVGYPMAGPDDLAQTVKEIEALDRRVIPVQADVRDAAAMDGVVQQALAEFGKLDVVLANAGICVMNDRNPLQSWVDVSSVNFGGVLTTLNAAVPHLKAGSSMVVTGSLGALMGGGGSAYAWAKRALIPLVRELAIALAPYSIRVNGVHPTNCNTDMLQHEDMYRTFRPDLEHPTKDDAIGAFHSLQLMPTPWVEPADISQVMVFLASDESRYITGQFINCDAGGHLKI